jgi:NAD(P)-dependent dehydrogenase (short-subunit alcohol dehydrogenase family)
MGRLQDKVAIVIGAAGKGNMGQAIARRFRQEGAQVVVTSRRGADLEVFAREIDCLWTVCDLTKKADVFALAKFTKEKLGRVDIAVNSTGIAVGGPFTEFSEEDLDKLIALQFKGSFFFLQAMVDAMDQGGSIIQISSATAQPTGTVASYEAYMGTKAGIDHVVRAVANFHGRQGIRVNTISVGHTDTPMQKVPLQDWRKAAYADATPLGRYGTCEDVAAACAWLASDECFMTGQALQVNGGLTLRRNPLAEDIERYEREWGKSIPVR